MAKIQAVWAIDVGQAALKALKLVPGEAPDQVTAEAFDFVEYPKILSQPDADPDELVREALATFTDRNELKGCKVAIAVPGQAGLVKFIKLPPVEKKRIPDIVKFEAKQQIPFALDEVVWAYQHIGGEGELNEEEFTMAEVGLFAMKRDQINRAILPFTVAGVEVDMVQMSPIALYNFISFDQLKASNSKESVVLLDIGADNTDLIITDGTRIWQRNVPIGGNHFTRALTKELKLTFAKAEHLKRNATKAPDPRAIFTAMRGVFNDFASEVNRSIGFYSSINRTAKIKKVIGMGNGFKLPGLQKFLQQNLNHEVTKLEALEKLAGDEVKSAPQFQDNLASFAVAYGLGIQGLGRGGLLTNLLPPEIERLRLVRSKKPWALAASALVLLGLTLLFTLGDYRVLAHVTTTPFKNAVNQAKTVSKRGATLVSEFDKAKGDWDGKFSEGKALVIDPTDRALWPDFLRTLSAFFPEPVKEYNLNPDDPLVQDVLEKLRVHIDAIKPVWRNDLKAEWFDLIDPKLKPLMHPYDLTNPPSGSGWVIQLVCHHYNPYPSTAQRKLPETDPARIEFGPYQYVTERILNKLYNPALRIYGIHHIALAWMTHDTEWTSEKGSSFNNLASNTVPLLDRAAPSAGAEGGAAGVGGGLPQGMKGMMGGMMGAMMGGGSGMMGGSGGAMMGGSGMRGGRGMMGGMMGMEGMMSRMQGPPGMMGGAGALSAKEAKKQLKMLTRTDFLLQFVWQPLKPEERPKTADELKTKVEEFRKNMLDAEKNHPAVTMPKVEEIEAASLRQSEALNAAVTKAFTPATGAGGAGAGAAGGPAAAPSSVAPPAGGAAAGAPAPGKAAANPPSN
jgi:type IV pilus assembly protein PilM